MRHAKSSWDSPASTDHERPLNDRGKRDAPRVARRLAELGWQPQHILSSDSQRTRETCNLLLAAWEAGIGVDYLASLYLAGPQELAKALSPMSDEIETLLVLGHNPGWEAVVHRLTDHAVTMKTASAAMLTAKFASWGDAFRQRWRLHDVIHPKELD